MGTTVGHALHLLSLALISGSALLGWITYLVAKRDGMGPRAEWNHWEGNHGPWQFYEPGNTMLNWVLALLFWGGMASLLAAIFRPRLVSLVLLFVSICAFFPLVSLWLFLGD